MCDKTLLIAGCYISRCHKTGADLVGSGDISALRMGLGWRPDPETDLAQYGGTVLEIEDFRVTPALG